MRIKKLINTSLIDWEGKIVSTLYVPHCNFRCPFCYNYDLILNPEIMDDIPIDKINDYLFERKDFIDGICMSGGEPTLYEELPDYFKFLKNRKFLIKLDTNGTNPILLKRLIESNLVDYIAMDIKSSIDFKNYSKAAGIKDYGLLNKVKESIELIINSKIDYEFRTTVTPILHTQNTITEIAKYISGAKRYILQSFSPQEKIIDASFFNVKPYSENFMQQLSEGVKKYFTNCSYR